MKRAVRGNEEVRKQTSMGGTRNMADTGPPVVLIAFGLILWLAVKATLAGISIQTIGLILFLAGAVWLVIELFQARSLGARRRETVVRERDVY